LSVRRLRILEENFSVVIIGFGVNQEGLVYGFIFVAYIKRRFGGGEDQ